MKSALRAARRGWHVLPLNWAIAGTCGCGDPECGSVGKHPLTAHGVKDATTDEATIQRWWREYPKANIGIATGKASDLIVLDVDPRHGGLESLRQFEDENGPLPDVPAVRTGGGGFHFYFKHFPGLGNKASLLPGFDVKSDGGYVVYPGSIHKSGKRYRWLHDRSPKKVRTVPVPPSLLRLTQSRKSAIAMEFESAIAEGKRNVALASLAGAMRSRGATQQAIEAALLEDNARRCNPPLRDSEVRNIALSISRYAPGDIGILSAHSKTDD
jgi:putative DNA primase/helicase